MHKGCSMKFNLQDPSDLELLEYEFTSISVRDWQAYLDFAEIGENWKRFDKKALKIGLDYCNNPKRASAKQQLWALNVAQDVQNAMEISKENKKVTESLETNQFKQGLKHFTLRVAWHDNKWNGEICKDPLNNRYCNGYHSLLSNRLRLLKEQKIQDEVNYAGKSIYDIPYEPPCYWSINLNGDKDKTVHHVNPAALDLVRPIEEKLKSNSIFSWPFAVAFNRDSKISQAEGAYPPNLDNVRAPLFREKIKPNESIAFFYANYSNPFSDEERQYLIIGAGLVQNKGDLLKFAPSSGIEEKKKQNPYKNKNFPEKNWALQFNFDPSTKVMMPYHEYLQKANGISDLTLRQSYLDKIKVTVSEKELIHCFKYVAMDIDDDEAIYILSKMRQKMMECKNDGIINPAEMDWKIEIVEALTDQCWKHRGYFPGFSKLAELFVEKDTKFESFIKKIYALENDDIDGKIKSILENPSADIEFKDYKNDVRDLIDAIKDREISIDQFLQLALLNLTKHQFERILSGNIIDFDTKYDTVKTSDKTPLIDICQNPYLLVEEYDVEEGVQDAQTGEDKDSPIELFKVDIAYFPESNIFNRLDIQRNVSLTDKRRLRCLIMKHLESLRDKGDCFEEASELENALRQYPLFYKNKKELALPIDTLKKSLSERDAFFNEPDKITIVDANETRYYYLQTIYKSEKYIGDKVMELLSQPPNEISFNKLDQYIESSIEKLKIHDSEEKGTFIDERSFLYRNIYSEKIFVLSGGPGSGKSHELLNIIETLHAEGENYLLLTPTGKAALRLKSDPNFPNVEAHTIDKWLHLVHAGKINKNTLLSTNNLIIDEMSMVDLEKFHEVLEQFVFSKPTFKRLILVGDSNQLPAIGFGKVLKDILFFLKNEGKHNQNFIHLSGNYRSELKGNKVIPFSKAFEESGEVEEDLVELLNPKGNDVHVSDGFDIIYWDDDNALKKLMNDQLQRLSKQQSIYGSLSEILFKLLGMSNVGELVNNRAKLDNFQILSPYLSGLSGADGLNDYIQRTFKKEMPSNILKGLFKESDKVIWTKNYYEGETLLIANGSMGVIKGGRSEKLYFQENNYEPIKLSGIRSAERESIELAYAISIHKSQGSGFDHLFIVIPNRIGFLSRELIYTALTRCRKSVTLFVQRSQLSSKPSNIMDLARRRTFTDCRKTSLLLNQPFRYYGLEPEEGVYVQSRSELMIYHALKKQREELGKDKFQFLYEEYPIVENNIKLKIKTDFTIIYNGKIWYWEHLGLLGKRSYERVWKTVKRPNYSSSNLDTSLITTDEIRGISPDKIENIIKLMIHDKVETEDITNKYSFHHYSLR